MIDVEQRWWCRVLNVVRQWVDKYFSDLVESNDPVLDELRTFLQSVSDTGGLYQFKTSILKLIDKQVRMGVHRGTNRSWVSVLDC